MKRLSDFSVLSFDCYGTLIDWESGMIDALAPLTSRVLPKLDRDSILQAHSSYESAEQRQHPTHNYKRVLATVYRRLSEHWGVPATWEECLVYGDSVRHWPGFSDSVDALSYLKKHYKLVILSNVDNDSFASSNEKLGVIFDAVYTAEDVGSYKPAEANFHYLLSRLEMLGVDKTAILHTAESLFHDHQPANKHDLASCWIYRRHAEKGFGATVDPGEMPGYDFRFNSLAEMVEAHQAELATSA